jgi:DNA-binding GntR family transcriptional regulator
MKPEGLSQVRHLTKREMAYHELRRAFFTGKFAPASSATISQLASQLNLGLMPVREAIQQLAYQGAFEFLPNRSIRVPVHDLDELDSLFKARLLLECFATAEAAKNITKPVITELRQHLKTIAELIQSDDFGQVQLFNYNFHFEIYRQCKNHYILDAIERLWLRAGPMHIAIWREHEGARREVERTLPLHKDLINALANNDSLESKKIMRKMLIYSREWFLSHYSIFENIE